MTTRPTLEHESANPGQAIVEWFERGWLFTRAAALIAVLMLSPSSYAGHHRHSMALHGWHAVVPGIFSFTLLCSLISSVIIRIVLVTAESYGLSQFALQTVVRVLVLELIPLLSALFVAVQFTLPASAEVAKLRARGGFDDLRARGIEPLRREVLPRALAGALAVPLFAAAAGVVALGLSYLLAYGATPWAFGIYTRVVGRVFDPSVTLIFAMKTLAFSLIVSMIPMASTFYDRLRGRSGTSVALQNLVRMATLILVVEALSLIGSYY